MQICTTRANKQQNHPCNVQPYCNNTDISHAALKFCTHTKKGFVPYWLHCQTSLTRCVLPTAAVTRKLQQQR